jgi:hypothetical protein
MDKTRFRNLNEGSSRKLVQTLRPSLATNPLLIRDYEHTLLGSNALPLDVPTQVLYLITSPLSAQCALGKKYQCFPTLKDLMLLP